MIKYFFLFILTVTTINIAQAQDTATMKKEYDSLLIVLKNRQTDTDRVKTLITLADIGTDGDTVMLFITEAIDLSQKIKYTIGELRARNLIGNLYWNVTNYPAALQEYMQVLKIADQLSNSRGLAAAYGNLGNTYYSLGSFRKALDYSFQAWAITRVNSIIGYGGFYLSIIAKSYLQLEQPDSALYFGKMALDSALKSRNDFFLALSFQALGDIFSIENDVKKSIDFYKKGLIHSQRTMFPLGTSGMMTAIAKLYYKNGQSDSAIYYAKQAFKIAQDNKALSVLAEAATLLHTIYKSSDEHQSMQYLEAAVAAKDSIFNDQKNNEFQNIAYNEEARQKDKEAAEIQYKSNLKFYGLIIIAAIIGIIALIQVRNNQQKKKANLVLESQKKKVESTLSELKSTQAQLIQSEKMASLGELTAGIAHEIQNPLNFVNNFSELNKELISELVDEAGKGNTDEVKAIANDIRDNSEKINHHGKRADAIVKGMLQHARSNKAVKELTDINALCDEYFRLAYHGYRSKDKSFNADTNTDFDSSLPKINVVPQDIGIVLLNLLNNAFYETNEKKKKLAGFQDLTGLDSYKPMVSIQTQTSGNGVRITISDNGNGIPNTIREKIFQPFFTTKPTGSGTGLGLSLSYDIIRAHGGEIKVETKDGKGTGFIVQLPGNG